eukprot:2077053-Pleurochrysis_carterae.AAC.2
MRETSSAQACTKRGRGTRSPAATTSRVLDPRRIRRNRPLPQPSSADGDLNANSRRLDFVNGESRSFLGVLGA